MKVMYHTSPCSGSQGLNTQCCCEHDSAGGVTSALVDALMTNLTTQSKP
jgi:hypothetical protein